jgi:hypothetical protein
LASWATREKILCFTAVFLSLVEFASYPKSGILGPSANEAATLEQTLCPSWAAV